jgi:hypothetical protein
MVDGYVRKRVTLRISKGLRAIALVAGISRRIYSDTRVIFITIITIYIMLAEKIGTPLITRFAELCLSTELTYLFAVQEIFSDRGLLLSRTWAVPHVLPDRLYKRLRRKP